MNTWAIVKVLCTDGIERIGIVEDHEVSDNNPNVFLKRVPSIVVSRAAMRHANHIGLELFNGEEHDTNDF